MEYAWFTLAVVSAVFLWGELSHIQATLKEIANKPPLNVVIKGDTVLNSRDEQEEV